ncbi:MAG: flagellar hook-basal body complex protein [Vampirovibrionales bacterium]|nr:flagellar hook-basal body complex protein [Vampirovibrionales bacterium]
MTLYSSVAGVRANQTRLDVIANNIANMNTTAFKSGDVRFSALFSQTLSGGSAPGGGLGGTNPQQVGSGVMVSDISTNFAQGGTQFTGRNTDLQIAGNGFFSLIDGNSTKLTRAGNFTLDSNGNMVAANGMKVQGTSQTSGTTSTTVEPIYIPTELQIAKDLSATGVIVGTFLGSAATPAASWLPATTALTAGAASRTTESVKLVSFSIGNTGAITATYSNGDRLTVREDPNTVVAGTPSATRLEFVHLPAEGGALGSDNDANGVSNVATDLGRVSQLAGTPVFTATNGGTAMQGMNFNLQTVTVTNPMGLLYEGNNNYSLGANTGNTFYGAPGNENRGGLQSGALESSNVDMAAEFTNMILSQRAIEASSKTISIQSSVLQSILQIQ